MLDKIIEIFKKAITLSVYEVVALSCALLPLIALAVLAFFGGGRAVKIKRGFKKIINQAKGENLSFEQACSLLHPSVSEKVKLARTIGELPSEYATLAACIDGPLGFSPKRKSASIILGVTMLSFALILALGLAVNSDKTFWLAFSCIAVGGVSTLCGLIISRVFIKRLYLSYEAAMNIIDSVYIQEITTSKNYDDEEFVEAEEAYDELSYDDEFVSGYDETVEDIIIDEPIEETLADEVIVEENLTSEVEEYIDECESVEPSEPEREDIVERVEQIALHGATIEEMKEVAALLKIERTKKENQNPVKKKVLDEAFALLLRSTSNARK